MTEDVTFGPLASFNLQGAVHAQSPATEVKSRFHEVQEHT